VPGGQRVTAPLTSAEDQGSPPSTCSPGRTRSGEHAADAAASPPRSRPRRRTSAVCPTPDIRAASRTFHTSTQHSPHTGFSRAFWPQSLPKTWRGVGGSRFQKTRVDAVQLGQGKAVPGNIRETGVDPRALPEDARPSIPGLPLGLAAGRWVFGARSAPVRSLERCASPFLDGPSGGNSSSGWAVGARPPSPWQGWQGSAFARVRCGSVA
jgi:hypothetical protein